MWGEAIFGGLRAGRFDSLSEIIDRPERYAAAGVVDWASGSVMLVARRCHDALGGWDESYFLYSEETDFCLRARDHGWLVRYTPEAAATHIGGHGERTSLRVLMVANRVELFRRRNSALRTAAFRAALLVHECLRARRGPQYRAAAWTLMTRRRPVPASR
jgi:GT2 family glycosyltransferase